MKRQSVQEETQGMHKAKWEVCILNWEYNEVAPRVERLSVDLRHLSLSALDHNSRRRRRRIIEIEARHMCKNQNSQIFSNKIASI